MQGYQFERRMKELYGDDEANWDRVGFSQIWLNEYLAKNPFVKKGAEEVDVANQHEFTLASGTGVEGDDVVSLSLKGILATDIVPEALRWLSARPHRLREDLFVLWQAGLRENLGVISTR